MTKEHLKRYFELVKTLEEQDRDFAEEIELMVDFIVISQTVPETRRFR